MILPDVTWGTLRAIALLDAQNGTITPENLLAHSAELYTESFNHEDDEYVWPDKAKNFIDLGEISDDVEVEDLDEGPDTITAAGTPEEEAPVEEMEFPTPIYFTVDENDNVLELVKADDEGLFIRIEGEWVDISDEDEFPTVYEKTIKFANDDSVSKWDSEFEDNDDLKLEDVQDYVIE
jgi:hypothetical protein